MKGGLGVVDFKKQNAALQIKFLDKFYNHKDVPWVKLYGMLITQIEFLMRRIFMVPSVKRCS
jgi:ubiquinone/menaquinone biosynthesis C-methylase UbiE